MCPYIPPRWRAALEFVLWLALAVVLALLGPPERTLGPNIRAVYLHGAWVWTALLGYAWAAYAALRAWLRRGRPDEAAWLRTSQVWGWVATFFWVTYLPVSLWAMQTNWNGLFLAEPRWRVGLAFAVAGVLLQIAALLLPRRADRHQYGILRRAGGVHPQRAAGHAPAVAHVHLARRAGDAVEFRQRTVGPAPRAAGRGALGPDLCRRPGRRGRG